MQNNVTDPCQASNGQRVGLGHLQGAFQPYDSLKEEVKREPTKLLQKLIVSIRQRVQDTTILVFSPLYLNFSHHLRASRNSQFLT